VKHRDRSRFSSIPLGDAQEPSSEVLQEILGDGAETKWREVDKATSDGTWGVWRVQDGAPQL